MEGAKQKGPRAFPAGVVASLDDLVRIGARARGIRFSAAQPSTSVLAGRHGSRLRGRGLDFEELRVYQPGDDIRTIDWRVSARARSPHVRVYSEEKQRPVTLLVDQRASMFFGSKVNMKCVTAAHAAAIVAQQAVRAGDQVGMVLFDDERISIMKPLRSQNQVTAIFGALRDANLSLVEGAREPDHAALDRALSHACKAAPHGHLIVFITDLTGASPETRRLATNLRRKNDVVVLFVHDPLEDRLVDVGQATLSDGRQQIQIDTSSATVRDRFRQDVAERRGRASALALHLDVPFLPISTETDVVQQLRALLGSASRPRRV